MQRQIIRILNPLEGGLISDPPLEGHVGGVADPVDRGVSTAGRGRGTGQQTYHQQRQNPQPQDQGPPQQSDRHFTSNNPDFTNLVKGINQGSRLQHASQNWEKLPNTLDRAIDRVSESIRPPLTDDKLSTKIKRAADHFKFAVVHAVREHITDKYASVCRHLASVDDLDFDQAKTIARKQISRSSGRITEERAERLIDTVRSDYMRKKRITSLMAGMWHEIGGEISRAPVAHPPIRHPLKCHQFPPATDLPP